MVSLDIFLSLIVTECLVVLNFSMARFANASWHLVKVYDENPNPRTSHSCWINPSLVVVPISGHTVPCGAEVSGQIVGPLVL